MVSFLLAAFGLMLALEGLAWAAAPNTMRRFYEEFFAFDERTIRTYSLIAAVAGVMIIWVAMALRG